MVSHYSPHADQPSQRREYKTIRQFFYWSIWPTMPNTPYETAQAVAGKPRRVATGVTCTNFQQADHLSFSRWISSDLFRELCKIASVFLPLQSATLSQHGFFSDIESDSHARRSCVHDSLARPVRHTNVLVDRQRNSIRKRVHYKSVRSTWRQALGNNGVTPTNKRPGRAIQQGHLCQPSKFRRGTSKASGHFRTAANFDV